MMNKTTKPVDFNDTVLQVSADVEKSQILYLWEPDNMPSVSEYTKNDNGYFYDLDFRPYLTLFPVLRKPQ